MRQLGRIQFAIFHRGEEEEWRGGLRMLGETMARNLEIRTIR